MVIQLPQAVIGSPLSSLAQSIHELLDFTPNCGEPYCDEIFPPSGCGGKVHHGGQVPLLASSCRRIICLGGYQGGKTVGAIAVITVRIYMDIAKWQPCTITGDVPENCKGHKGEQYAHLIRGRCDRTLIYWLVGKSYIMTEQEFFGVQSNLIELGMPVRPTTSFDPGKFNVLFKDEKYPRITVETKSERDAETAFTRVSPHGIAALECGGLQFSSWNNLTERTAGRNGWLLGIGTIEESQPWFSAMGKSWEIPDEEGDRVSFSLATYSNTALFKAGINDPHIKRLKEESSDERWQQRVEGKHISPQGLVFKDFSADLHVSPEIKYHPGNEVFIWVDPGYQRGVAAHAVEVAHIIDGQALVFDELHEYELTTDDVIDWCEVQPWWAEKANTKITLAIDPFYVNVHHASGSVGETWRTRVQLTVSADNKQVPINESDARLKDFLKVRFDIRTGTLRPKIVFSPKVTGVISEFGGVPSPHSMRGEILAYKYNVDSGGNNIGNQPKSQYCDGIRAIENGLIEHFGRAILSSRAGRVRRY